MGGRKRGGFSPNDQLVTANVYNAVHVLGLTAEREKGPSCYTKSVLLCRFPQLIARAKTPDREKPNC